MSDPLRFAKYQGAGNDFVILDGRAGRSRAGTPAADTDWPALARAMCDRHFGIGADGLLVASEPPPGRPPATSPEGAQPAGARPAIRMRMFNPDGSEAEMCGNGLRCFARWLVDRGELGEGLARVQTGAGLLWVDVGSSGRIAAGMGVPRLAPRDIPLSEQAAHGQPPAGPVQNLLLSVGSATLDVTCVSMGNPHAVCFTADVAAVPLAAIGPRVERHPYFPARTNVEFVQVLAPDRLRVRVWERGAGITLACGTGACAALVAARLHGLAAERATLELPGGDLEVRWPGGNAEVVLGGPALRVFDGRWSVQAVQ
jgi:diaminopimelate epimerase